LKKGPTAINGYNQSINPMAYRQVGDLMEATEWGLVEGTNPPYSQIINAAGELGGAGVLFKVKKTYVPAQEPYTQKDSEGNPLFHFDPFRGLQGLADIVDKVSVTSSAPITLDILVGGAPRGETALEGEWPLAAMPYMGAKVQVTFGENVLADIEVRFDAHRLPPQAREILRTEACQNRHGLRFSGGICEYGPIAPAHI